MKLYYTVYQEAKAEYITQKSRFIAHISPVDSCDEAKAFISSIKSEYKDATHNVPVMVVGDKQEIQWSSEDGEPQGTAGAPILRMIIERGLTNLAIVVTRYFGGIKLDKQFNLTDLYTTYNKIGFSDSKLLAQIYSLEQSLSREDQAKQFAALKKAINKDASYIPICYRAYWFLTVETLKNADKVSFFSPYEGAETWEWSKRKTE